MLSTIKIYGDKGKEKEKSDGSAQKDGIAMGRICLTDKTTWHSLFCHIVNQS